MIILKKIELTRLFLTSAEEISLTIIKDELENNVIAERVGLTEQHVSRVFKNAGKTWFKFSGSELSTSGDIPQNPTLYFSFHWTIVELDLQVRNNISVFNGSRDFEMVASALHNSFI